MADFFKGHDPDQQLEMLKQLLNDLSRDSDKSSVVSVLTRVLDARDKVESMIKTHFEADILPCNPLDNIINFVRIQRKSVRPRFLVSFNSDGLFAGSASVRLLTVFFEWKL